MAGAEIQSECEVGSDQERTEKIEERPPMALAGSGCAVSRASAEETACAICRQRRQNNVRIDHGDDGLSAKLQGRRQVYRRIRLIELGFGEVDSGDNGYAD